MDVVTEGLETAFIDLDLPGIAGKRQTIDRFGGAPASSGSAVRVEEPAKSGFGLAQAVFGQQHRLGFGRGVGD